MTDAAKPRRNHALWAGPLVALFGLASYWTLFRRWPALSDFPWVNLAILAVGLGLCLVGLRRAWGRGIWRPSVAVLGLGVSAWFGSVLIWYCFVNSYRLPATESALAVGASVPEIALVDHRGRTVELDGDGRARLVVFFRGFW